MEKLGRYCANPQTIQHEHWCELLEVVSHLQCRAWASLYRPLNSA